jgi:hypothetical protein
MGLRLVSVGFSVAWSGVSAAIGETSLDLGRTRRAARIFL